MTHTASATPSTMPREARCYDPTTPPHFDHHGTLHLYSRADVHRVLVDWKHFSADLSELLPPGSHPTTEFMWGSDRFTVRGEPGRHPVLRRLPERHYTNAAVADLVPLMRDLARSVIDEAIDKTSTGEIDCYADIAVPYSLRLACAIAGVPRREAAWLVDRQREHGDIPDGWPPPEQPEVDEYFRELFARDSAMPGTVLDTVTEALREGQITEREAWGQVWGFIQASVLTSAAALTLVVGLLLEYGYYDDPAITDTSDDTGLERAIEEALRFGAAFPVAPRSVIQPTNIGGFDVERGQSICAWLAAADRDPAVNGDKGAEGPDPQRFIPTRWPNRHLALAAGVHHCAGARLARTELLVAMRELYATPIQLELLPGWRRYAATEDGFLSAPVRITSR